jgi:hypothetical protein
VVRASQDDILHPVVVGVGIEAVVVAYSSLQFLLVEAHH